MTPAVTSGRAAASSSNSGYRHSSGEVGELEVTTRYRPASVASVWSLNTGQPSLPEMTQALDAPCASAA